MTGGGRPSWKAAVDGWRNIGVYTNYPGRNTDPEVHNPVDESKAIVRQLPIGSVVKEGPKPVGLFSRCPQTFVNAAGCGYREVRRCGLSA
jgi:hypothetical protein